MTTSLEWARAYRDRGWAPTPVHASQKNPVLIGWTTLDLTASDLPKYFGREPINIGVRLGEPSGGLVDIDLDAAEAVRLARYFLPPTDAVFGRPGKPASHWLYVAYPLPFTEKFQAPGPRGGMLVELRSTGAQTVFPPSYHPTGERILWAPPGAAQLDPPLGGERAASPRDIPTPARVSGDALLRDARQLAAAALLARLWPAPGGRNDFALALAGGLVRLGWDAIAVAMFVFVVAEAAGDEEAGKRARAAKATAEKAARGEPVTGWATLETLLGTSVVYHARRWASARSPWKAYIPDVAVFGPAWRSWGEEREGGEAEGKNGKVGEEAEGKDGKVEEGGEGTSLSSLPSHLFPSSSPSPSVVPVASVAEEPLRWLWPGYLPLGKLVVLDGDPGLGKSTLTLDLAARVSRGLPMPNGSLGDVRTPGGVLLLSAEDGVGDTIRPRLQAAGADLNRVHVMAEYQVVSLDSHIEALRSWMAAVQARLVIVDPLMAFLGALVNPYRDADIRQALAPVCAAAEAQGATVLIVRHLNKSLLGPALYRGGGSIGIIGAARAGLLVGADPHDKTGLRRALAVTKNNLAARSPSLAYHMEPCGTTVRVVWDGPSDHTAETLLNGGGAARTTPAVDDAVTFLLDALGQGSRPAQEIEVEAAQRGLKRRTLQRARKVLGVAVAKDGFNGGWTLSLPEERQPPAKSATSGI